MAWFFADRVNVPYHTITGEDAVHIIKSLRMKQGEALTICDSEEIRQYISAHYSYDLIAKQYIEQYRKVQETVHT